MANLGEDRLWQHFEAIGIKAIHIGPVKLAGGVGGWRTSPSIDGDFRLAEMAFGIDPASLVHGMQNHDDLTYELVHFWSTHKNDEYYFRASKITGSKLREVVRSDMQNNLTGAKAPYNLLFTKNGIACTTVSVITAVLGISDLKNLTEDQIDQIIKVHLLLVMVHHLDNKTLQLTILNFGPEAFEGTITSEHLPPQSTIHDLEKKSDIASIDDLHNFHLTLEPYDGRFLIINT